MAQYEKDLASVVHSLILSISENDLHFVKSGPCNASCLKFSLVKLLRLSGYDAAVCVARWQGSGKVPGGMPFTSILQNLYFIEFGFFFCWVHKTLCLYLFPILDVNRTQSVPLYRFYDPTHSIKQSV